MKFESAGNDPLLVMDFKNGWTVLLLSAPCGGVSLYRARTSDEQGVSPIAPEKHTHSDDEIMEFVELVRAMPAEGDQIN